MEPLGETGRGHREPLSTIFATSCDSISKQKLYIHKYIHPCSHPHTHMIHNNLDRSQIHYAKQRKQGKKAACILKDFILWHSGKGTSLGAENRLVIFQGLHEKQQGGVWDDGAVLYPDCCGVTWIYTCVKTYGTIHQKIFHYL